MTALRVWFNRTYATAVHTLPLLRGNPGGVEVHLLGSHVDPSSPVLAAVDEVLPEQDGKGADYAERAVELCRQHQIDVLWPTWQAQAVASRREDFGRAGTLLLTGSASSQAICDDKGATYAAVRDAGVTVPEHRVVTTSAELLHGVADLRDLGPLCFKPSVASGGDGFRILRETPLTRADLEGIPDPTVHLEEVLAALGDSFEPLLLMPFLPGPELSVDVLALDGKVVRTVTRSKDDAVRGASIVDVPGIAGEVERVVAALGLTLLSNVQFRLDRHGVPTLLEVNARASGGIFKAALAGVNLPWAALQLLTTGATDVPIPRTPTHLVDVQTSVRTETASGPPAPEEPGD